MHRELRVSSSYQRYNNVLPGRLSLTPSIQLRHAPTPSTPHRPPIRRRRPIRWLQRDIIIRCPLLLPPPKVHRSRGIKHVHPPPPPNLPITPSTQNQRHEHDHDRIPDVMAARLREVEA